MPREAKLKPVAPCLCNFSHALSMLDVIASNFDWFIVLFAPVVIGWSNYIGIGFFDSHLKPLYYFLSDKL